MTQCFLESAYIRFIIDEQFADRVINDPAFGFKQGLTPDNIKLFIDLGNKEALKVERRGRLTELWKRVSFYLPWTIACIETCHSAKILMDIKHGYFCSDFWNFNISIPIFPYGKGFELATSFYSYLTHFKEKDIDFKLWAELSELEWNRFRIIQTYQKTDLSNNYNELIATGTSQFDLFNAIKRPSIPAHELVLDRHLNWGVSRRGDIGKF